MRDKINLVLLVFVCYATAAQAQEPQWELFAKGLSGPIAVDPTNSDVITLAPARPACGRPPTAARPGIFTPRAGA